MIAVSKGRRMKFTIVAVGKLKEKFWTAACAEYLKRMQPYGKTEVREIADVDPARAGGVDAARDIAFVIGGSDGVSAAVRQRADETLSFGPITLPHNLARVVLLEQLYRAQKISRGEPYHK